jgi:hypothetical protein
LPGLAGYPVLSLFRTFPLWIPGQARNDGGGSRLCCSLLCSLLVVVLPGLAGYPVLSLLFLICLVPCFFDLIHLRGEFFENSLFAFCDDGLFSVRVYVSSFSRFTISSYLHTTFAGAPLSSRLSRNSSPSLLLVLFLTDFITLFKKKLVFLKQLRNP